MIRRLAQGVRLLSFYSVTHLFKALCLLHSERLKGLFLFSVVGYS